MGTNVWICCMTGEVVGIVKKYDEIEGRWKYYIGCGEGKDIDEDIQRVVDYGQKFDSLDFLRDLMEPENLGDANG